MSDKFNIHKKSEMARQLAYEELKNNPEYRFKPIPSSILDDKMREYMQLSDKELQDRINSYWASKQTPQTLWQSMGVEVSNQPPTPARQNAKTHKETEIRSKSVDILSRNASRAKSMVEEYRNGIGYISSDAFVQGMNVIGDSTWDLLARQNDFVTVFEQEEGLSKELEKLNSLKSHTASPLTFKKEFKQLYGIDFNYSSFEELTNISQKLDEVNAYESLNNYFTYGMQMLEKGKAEGFQLDALLSPLFGNNIMKTSEYINQLKASCKDENELKVKVYAVLYNAKENAEKSYDRLMQGTNRETLESEYKSAYKKAMGDYNSEEIIESYIQMSKTNAMLSETAMLISGSFLVSGGKFVSGMGTKLIAKFGPKVGVQMMKAGMTGTLASLPAAETVISGLTSNEGLTSDKISESFEQLKNGMIYGTFGAYVSGPLGTATEKLLSRNPRIFSEIIASKLPRIIGAGVETSADVLFDALTSDMSIQESLTQNGLMNYGMMYIGGRMQKVKQDLSNIQVEKMNDGTYNIVDIDGNLVGKAKNDNELGVAILGLGKDAYDKFKSKTKNLLLNHTSFGRKLKNGIERARFSATNNFQTSGKSSFDKIKDDIKSKLINDFSTVSNQLATDEEFIRLFQSFIKKNASNKPELQYMLAHYDLSGMNDAKLLKSLIETSGVGVTKIAQIISKDKTIMGKLEASLPPDEFKSLQDALINCQSKCDFSRTVEQAQLELDKAFPLNPRNNSSAVSVYGAQPHGEYAITKENSAGSVGATYWAIDKDGNKVVVKMLKDGVDMEQLGLEEKLFKKLMSAFATTPEDAQKYAVMIHNQYKDWYEELDFKQEAINNKKLADGAQRYTVAKVRKVSKDGTSLIMDTAQGVQMNKIMEMLEFYKQNPNEYLSRYTEIIKNNQWLSNPKKVLSELPTTLIKTFDEQMLFMKKGGETVMHGDPHMGNLFVYQNNKQNLKIEFIDTGNCITRNSEQIKGDISFFSNYLVGNAEGLAKYFMIKADYNPDSEIGLLKEIAENIDKRIFKKGENITQFANVQKELNTILEEAGLEVGTDESNALKAQFQFISNVSALNSLSGKPLDIAAIFKDIPTALTTMVRNGVNPIPSVKDALKYSYNNTLDVISNAMQFKIKKSPETTTSVDVIEHTGNNGKTFKYTRKTLSEIKFYIKNRHNMTDTEKAACILEIAQNAKLVKSQVEELIKHLTSE